MRLISILKSTYHCLYHCPGFVNVVARRCGEAKAIEIDVRSRVGSKGKCSSCHKPAPTYDHLPVRRFEFVAFWGFAVFLLYLMRRVDCQKCGVKAEEVPWGCAKHQMTTAYVLFLARRQDPPPIADRLLLMDCPR